MSPAGSQRSGGPVLPSPGSSAVLQPLRSGPFEFGEGYWHTRRRVTTERSIPQGLLRLREHGTLANLRRAAGHRDEAYQGRSFSDSDVYKMAEALAWDGDAAHELTVLADLISAAQLPSGYLSSWTQCQGLPEFADPQMGHEMYCAGHLIQAAIAAARTLGRSDLLTVAVRFADHLDDRFGEGGRPGICGHPQIEMALVELYRLTGEHRYLALAGRMIDLRGHGLLGPGLYGAAYYEDHVPVRHATELEGHCVRAFYLAAGATDVAVETGDRSLLDALERQWAHTLATKSYLTGGVGCRRKIEAFGAPYELPPDHAFSETCAAIGHLMWDWRLLLATGDGRYADHMERLLFNVLAAGSSLDGDRFSYVNPLQRHAAAMEEGDKAPYRRQWFGCACCPPNLMRTIASLGHYVATTDDTGIQVHQYATGRLAGDGLSLDIRTDYPWDGRIAITVDAAPAADRTIALRVPAWCTRATVTVNGAPLAPQTPALGYLRPRRRWLRGDRIVLELAMPARLTWPDQRIDGTRGCVAIERGPLVYCLEAPDQQPGVALDRVSIDVQKPLTVVHRPDLLDGVVTIEAAGVRHDAGDPGWPYQQQPDPGTATGGVRVTAIPYYAWDNRGLAKMRTWIPAG
jgi:DUF1680 family protein